MYPTYRACIATIRRFQEFMYLNNNRMNWQWATFYLQLRTKLKPSASYFELHIYLFPWFAQSSEFRNTFPYHVATRRLHDARMRGFPKPRAVSFSAASLHVPHKEKRLHPAKAFTGMRQVSQVGRKKKRREKGGRILPRRRGKVFLAHHPILRTNLPQRCFPYFRVLLARFFPRVYVRDNKRLEYWRLPSSKVWPKFLIFNYYID